MTLKRTLDLRLKFTPALRALMPKHVQALKGPKFQRAVGTTLRELLEPLGGLIKSMTVADDGVQIAWEQPLAGPAPLVPVVQLLQKGKYDEAILVLELLLSAEPDEPDYLYNLGMAYSDLGQLSPAIERLSRLVEVEPQHINGRVALGVALTRAKQTERAVQELQIAVSQAPDNPWAQRNLGGALANLGKFALALPHLRRATELNPQDQAAWYGLAQALELTDDTDGADAAYLQALEVDEFGPLADLARAGRSRLAQKGFRTTAPQTERMDAVMYCLGALEKFAGLNLAEIQKIGFEIALLGTRGINVNDPGVRYTLRSLPGDFSGLHLLCLEYVAFKQFAPQQDIGFDLSKEYQTALGLYQNKA